MNCLRSYLKRTFVAIFCDTIDSKTTLSGEMISNSNDFQQLTSEIIIFSFFNWENKLYEVYGGGGLMSNAHFSALHDP